MGVGGELKPIQPGNATGIGFTAGFFSPAVPAVLEAAVLVFALELDVDVALDAASAACVALAEEQSLHPLHPPLTPSLTPTAS